MLAHTTHRPFPLPQGPWLMKQTWNDLLFAHWPVNEAHLTPYIPPGLELQQWEGTPWISVSPFLIDPLRLRGCPRLPFVHRFLELNIRTYVVNNGKAGVFFLNLDASSRLAVGTARAAAHLPYRYAKMSCHSDREYIQYSSRKQIPGYGQAEFTGSYKAKGASVFHAEPGSLLHWLTERYCLYASGSKNRLYVGDIHHLPWTLQEADLQIDTNTATRSLGLIHAYDPLLLTYTKRLEVLFWPVRRIMP
ncbi:hypothetical protein AML91_26575 [Paenibacillus jilunlii]|uniref:DUF2071 domain-containing protein n=1 Tax=Paenibacillus jilunlii TaxID=682956 RepID=A0ABR5SN69_9BACL|nr:hypothetical protein AML91_26575 [Paenibacillus jilunlii]